MYTTLENGNKSVRVIANHYGKSMFLSFWQIKKVRKALGVSSKKEMSEGIGDPRYEWVRNKKAWGGAIFRIAELDG